MTNYDFFAIILLHIHFFLVIRNLFMENNIFVVDRQIIHSLCNLDKHKQTEKIKIAYLQICNTVGPLVFRFSLHGLYLPDQVDGK